MNTSILTVAQESATDPANAASAGDGAIARVTDSVASMIDFLDILTRPEDLMNLLGSLGIVWGGILLVVGILCVINGYRWHRWVIIVCAFLCGFALGYVLSKHMEQPYVVAAALALMAAVISNPLLKFSVALFGGLTGAFIGANIWTGLGLPGDAHWAGALMGLILVGMASFLMFKHVVVFFTAMSGGAMTVCGAIAILLYVPDMRESVARLFTNNQILVPLLITVAGVIGLVIQEQQARAPLEEGGE